MSALITVDLVTLDENLGDDRFAVIRHLTGKVCLLYTSDAADE